MKQASETCVPKQDVCIERYFDGPAACKNLARLLEN
jgi:hypothetical protein